MVGARPARDKGGRRRQRDRHHPLRNAVVVVISSLGAPLVPAIAATMDARCLPPGGR
ncbi:hypothetical protein [Geodermatophilus sp. SYSU D01036]